MSQKLPSFSIVTPSFQQAQFIEATLQSVLEQDYPALDYLVMDGGSTDGTVDILRQYEERVRWVSEPDDGQADAINKGFSRSNGEILGWLNSDDTYAAGAIRAVAEVFSRNPQTAVVYGDADFIDFQGRRIGRCAHIEPFNRQRLLKVSDYLVQPAVFFRRDAFQAVNGLDPTLNWAMDYDLWLKLAATTTFIYLPKVLANYRWLDTSKTGSGGRKRLDEVATVVRQHGAQGLPAYFRLEKVRLDLLDAAESIRNRKFSCAGSLFGSAAMTLLTSWRAIFSLFTLKTWRVIWMGQVIRAHADRAAGPPREASPSNPA